MLMDRHCRYAMSCLLIGETDSEEADEGRGRTGRAVRLFASDASPVPHPPSTCRWPWRIGSESAECLPPALPSSEDRYSEWGIAVVFAQLEKELHSRSSSRLFHWRRTREKGLRPQAGSW